MRSVVVVLVAALLIACANESPHKDDDRAKAAGPTPASIIGGTTAPSPELSVPRDHRKRPKVSLDKAVQRIQRRLDLPLALPPALIEARVKDLYFGLWGPNDPGADLTLVLPDGSTVLISAGHVSAHGCGDGSPRPDRYLEIMGQPAILRSFGRGQHVLIWPATKRGPVGTYGISGRLRPATLLRWAEFIQSVGSPRGDAGC